MTNRPVSAQYKKLIAEARKAKKNSHAPYSNFHVGAALLTASGKIFTGSNIENSSFSLTICAERTAFFKAYSEGSRRFKAVAIVSDSADFIPPCGACRQVMMDLAGNIDIIITNGNGDIIVEKLSTLLPMAFDQHYLITK